MHWPHTSWSFLTVPTNSSCNLTHLALPYLHPSIPILAIIYGLQIMNLLCSWNYYWTSLHSWIFIEGWDALELIVLSLCVFCRFYSCSIHLFQILLTDLYQLLPPLVMTNDLAILSFSLLDPSPAIELKYRCIMIGKTLLHNIKIFMYLQQ